LCGHGGLSLALIFGVKLNAKNEDVNLGGEKQKTTRSGGSGFLNCQFWQCRRFWQSPIYTRIPPRSRSSDIGHRLLRVRSVDGGGTGQPAHSGSPTSPLLARWGWKLRALADAFLVQAFLGFTGSRLLATAAAY